LETQPQKPKQQSKWVLQGNKEKNSKTAFTQKEEEEEEEEENGSRAAAMQPSLVLLQESATAFNAAAASSQRLVGLLALFSCCNNMTQKGSFSTPPKHTIILRKFNDLESDISPFSFFFFLFKIQYANDL